MEGLQIGKERDDLKAARKRTQARFEALLNVGSGGNGSNEVTVPKPRRQRKKERNLTAESYLSMQKKNPDLSKRRSQSQESLLKVHSSVSANRNESTSKSEVEKHKKKKTEKKRKAKKADAEYNEGEHQKNATQNSNTDDTVHEQTGEVNFSSEKKSSKVRKKKQNLSHTERIMHALNTKKHDDGLLFCVIIHKADELRPDFRIRHPVIRIHVVNMNNGHYIKKTDPMRKVLSLYENENIDYILPVLTQPYDITKHRCLTPQWNETMLYNEIYSYFLQREPDDPPVILFFELLDFALMTTKLKDLSKTDHGWHRLAWAFLKIVSPNGSTNTGRKLRLQFYQPISRIKVTNKDDNKSVDIFDWWKFGVLTKYPSTLYVTVKGVLPPSQLNPTTRSMFPLQKEEGGVTFEELNSTLDSRTAISDHEKDEPSWIKLPGQINRIPNSLYMKLPAAKKGCSVVKFSSNGKYLACACAAADGFPVIIFEFPDGKVVVSLENHFGIVYDLCWSVNNAELLSSSADCTVRCWDMKRFSASAIKLLPHPSFVYCGQYHPKEQRIVVTASFDKVIRVWDKMSESHHATLLRELDVHKSHVNFLAFSNDGHRFFSADGDGFIKEWSCYTESKKKVDLALIVSQWSLLKSIDLEELKKTSVDTVHLHPNQLKLLIHSRDSLLRMLDLRSYGIQKVYIGGYNFKEYIRATFSSCGSFIFCGTENGVVHVWSTETGQLLYSYNQLGYVKAVSAAHFHPHDNYIAFCCYGDSQPILIYTYDPKVQLEIQQAQNASHNPEFIETQRRVRDSSDQYVKMRETANSSYGMNSSRIEKAYETLKMVTHKPSEDKRTVTFKMNEMSPRQTMMSTWGSDFSYTGEGFRTTTPSSQLFPETKNTSNSRSPLNHSNQGFPKKAKTVISLYEYEPTRADELALQPNDVITVLSEENSNWWMGQLPDGRQGYFPVNYVMEMSHFQDKEEEDDSQREYIAALNRQGDLRIISAVESNQIKVKRPQKKRKSLMSNEESIA